MARHRGQGRPGIAPAAVAPLPLGRNALSYLKMTTTVSSVTGTLESTRQPTLASLNRTGWIAARFGVAGVGIVTMSLALLLVGGFVGGNAIHLCGWPARMTCDAGTWLWWLLPTSASIVALAGAALLLRWAFRNRSVYLVGLAHVFWTIGLFPVALMTQPRTFGWSELIVGGVWGGIGIELLRVFGIVTFPANRRTVHRVIIRLWVVYALVLATVPSTLDALV